MDVSLSYFASAGILFFAFTILIYIFKAGITFFSSMLIALKLYNLRKYNQTEYKKYLKYKKDFLEKNVKGPMVSGLEESNEIAGMDYDILGIKEPKGKWQKFVMSRKIGYLISLREAMEKNSKSGKKMGYWQLVVKANSIMRGKGSDRGF